LAILREGWVRIPCRSTFMKSRFPPAPDEPVFQRELKRFGVHWGKQGSRCVVVRVVVLFTFEEVRLSAVVRNARTRAVVPVGNGVHRLESWGIGRPRAHGNSPCDGGTLWVPAAIIINQLLKRQVVAKVGPRRIEVEQTRVTADQFWWDESFWKAEVELTDWRGFQSRGASYDSLDSADPADGKVTLVFAPEGRGDEPLTESELILVTDLQR